MLVFNRIHTKELGYVGSIAALRLACSLNCGVRRSPPVPPRLVVVPSVSVGGSRVPPLAAPGPPAWGSRPGGLWVIGACSPRPALCAAGLLPCLLVRYLSAVIGVRYRMGDPPQSHIKTQRMSWPFSVENPYRHKGLSPGILSDHCAVFYIS